jgi:hypothetical protein
VSILGTRGALARGRWIEHFQHEVGLPGERSVQQLVTGHPLLEQACNLYYASMHFGVLGAFLLWMFVRHRDRYPAVRTVLVISTAVCLVIQLLPVAPPRLLPELGFVDTAAQYGQSVYNLSGITVDSLAAMPSVHVSWALLVGWAVITVSTSRYRWWVLVHPVVTVFVVVATANHFWLDAIVAAAVLLVTILLVGSLSRQYDRDAGRRGPVQPRERSRRGREPDLAGDQPGGIQLAAGDLSQ